MLPRQLFRIAILLLALTMTGCATTLAKEENSTEYDELYDGEMQLAHEAADHEVTLEEAIANGDRALADGNTDQAMYEYVHALQLSGGDAQTLNKIGAIHMGLGNLRLAARAYSFSLRLEPGNTSALEGVGLLLLQERRYDEARQHLTAALAADSERWQCHNGLGVLADLDGNHETAITHFRQALDVSSGAPGLADKARVLNNLGYSLYLKNDRESALKYFHKALYNDPGFDRAWENLGLVYTRQGDYYRAVDAYSHVMDKPQAYNNIGFLCMINEEYKCAEHYFNIAIKLSPSYYVKAHENMDRLKMLH